jgi:hypothetical protein
VAVAGHSIKPKFRPFETWGACSRCGARVAHRTLKRERLTGLLMCTEASCRPVRPCWDPWPEVYDFQVFSDRSIEPPPEPLPARWNLDAIWGNGPASGTTKDFANAPKPAPDDTTRLNALMRPPANSVNSGVLTNVMGAFANFRTLLNQNQDAATLTSIVPQAYDGTFVPSGSVRTVVPPNAAAELAAVTETDQDLTTKLWGPPAGVNRGV